QTATPSLHDALPIFSRGFADRYLPGGDAPARSVPEDVAREHAAQIAGSYDSSRRPETTFMAVANLLGPVKVIANEDGTISVTARSEEHTSELQSREK